MEHLGIKWTPEIRQVSALKQWEKNPRKISPDAHDRLKEKVQREGMHQVLTIDQDGTVLSGNQRLEILRELGVLDVWCMIPERVLTEDERERVALESNVHEGRWKIEMLRTFDQPKLVDMGIKILHVPETKNQEVVDTKQSIDCPHCARKIGMSNRVKRIWKIDNAA